MNNGYTLENARKFGWASITGKLNPSRVSLLETHLVGKKILDAGCSGGAYAEFVAAQHRHVTGLDRYADFLRLAINDDHKGMYVQGDVTSLPFTDKSFDSTYCFDVLEHVDDLKALRELARVTAKRLILVVPQENQLLEEYGLTFYHYIDPTHLRYYTEESFNKLIANINPARVTLIPDQNIKWNWLIREMVQEDMPALHPANILNVPLILRTIKYLAQDLAGARTPDLKSSLSKAKKNNFIKQMSRVSFKEIPMELIAIVDLVENAEEQ
jgi:ubiquinone/menaquinone biosynthesis C-methylase UbiE